MKIGIFGGTFDPPHYGHLALAKACIEQLELDELIFLPANRNPLKTRTIHTAAKHRMAMVQKLIAKEEKMAVSDMEITRGGASYTVDTLGELQMVQPADYWFLMGADSLKGISNWKNPQRLLRLCRIGVVIRPPMSESDVTSRIPEEFKDRIDLVKMTPVEVSSTELRERLAEGKNITGHLPETVLRYIQENKLYKN